jgi:hypothetical protein
MGTNPQKVARHLLGFGGYICLTVLFTDPLVFHSTTFSLCTQGIPESGWWPARP